MKPLGVGDLAPDFALRDQHGATVRLSGFHGDQHVLLVFYPWAFSRVCTGELCQLRDEWPRLDRDDVTLLGISCDAMFSQRAFAESDGIGFSLLADWWPHGATATAYGVFDEQLGCSRRSTFVVDKQGVVAGAVHSALGEPRNLSDYLEILDAL